MQSKAFNKIYNGWKKVAKAIGFVNIRIILSLVFIVIFIPAGLLHRIFSKESNFKAQKRESYWMNTLSQRGKDAYKRQY